MPAVAGQGAIPLDTMDLVISTLLILAAGVTSILLRLGLERRLLLAAIRTVLQLLLVGYVLEYVFGLNTWWAVMAVLAIMFAVAAHAAVGRSSRTFPGAYALSLLSLVACGMLVVTIVTGVIVGVEPWWTPQYLIPLLGMILGNSLTGISLGLDHLLESLDRRRPHVELLLMMGATRWEAARSALAEAVRRAMIPTINTMMVVGVVSLPGMMTGQILEGADPLKAVRYQIMVMFMIAAATSLGAISIALLVYRRFFNSRHQLVKNLIRSQ
jgi:putative ABC transport system permease protein